MSDDSQLAATVDDGPAALVLEPWTVELLNGIARELGFVGDIEVNHSAGSNLGDNFMGIMVRIVIEGQRNGAADRHVLMLKMPPQSAARRKQFQSAVLFERETVMYRDVLPMLVKFQLDKGFTPDDKTGFFMFPKCHAFVCDAANDRYAIVMEDLKQQGYQMFNKYDVINLEHVRFVMEELGKFHGLSFALRDQRPDLFAPLSEMKDIFLENMIRGNLEMMTNFMDACFGRAISSLDDTETVLRSKLERLSKGFVEQMEQCVLTNSESERFNVINHGDCWNNNMMYMYKGSAVPHRICLIDFQIARCASPILDIVYFLFSSTTKDVREKHFEEILAIYHSALTATVNALGSDAERLFSWADFRQQLTKYGKYGVLIAPMLLQVITAHPDDLPDMDAMAEEREKTGVDQLDLFVSPKTELLYNKRMRDVLRDADAYGFLSEF